MTDYPTLSTDRLVLRKLESEDLPSLCRLANNRSIADQIINIDYPYNEFHAAMRLAHVNKGFNHESHFCFGIFQKETSEFIGEVSLHLTDPERKVAELGYWIGEPYWNQGYASEAVSAILPFGYEEKSFHHIYATSRSTNLASQRVLAKNHMTVFSKDALQHKFKLTREDFRNSI